MKIIYGGRKTGKTTALIEMCDEATRNGELSYIVCGNVRNAQIIMQKAKEMGKDIPFPITYDEFMRHQYAGVNIKKFFFDNADRFIQCLTNVEIAVLTVNKTEEEDAP